MNKFSHIKNFFTDNIGGGNILDVFTLEDGSVIVINDEYLGHYKSIDDFDGGEDQLNGFYLKGASKNEAN
jgi:hypothetical protein